jgi:hypothetical protein
VQLLPEELLPEELLPAELTGRMSWLAVGPACLTPSRLLTVMRAHRISRSSPTGSRRVAPQAGRRVTPAGMTRRATVDRRHLQWVDVDDTYESDRQWTDVYPARGKGDSKGRGKGKAGSSTDMWQADWHGHQSARSELSRSAAPPSAYYVRPSSAYIANRDAPEQAFLYLCTDYGVDCHAFRAPGLMQMFIVHLSGRSAVDR